MSLALSAQASLAQQQNALLASIFAAHANPPTRGLAAYRANAHANAARALQVAYPVMAQLMGEDNFHYLAMDFWHQHPPQRGDLAQWGSALPAFLAASEQLVDTPYLADVGHIEWALHRCTGEADRAQDAASFAVLALNAPEAVSFLTAAGALVLSSPYPAAAVVLAHQGHGSMELAAAKWHAGVAQTALVWREGFAPRLDVLKEADIAFTGAVCAGQNLAYALDHAHPDFDFSSWLTTSVRRGLVLGVMVHP
jgi:hypothetical protein